MNCSDAANCVSICLVIVSIREQNEEYFATRLAATINSGNNSGKVKFQEGSNR